MTIDNTIVFRDSAGKEVVDGTKVTGEALTLTGTTPANKLVEIFFNNEEEPRFSVRSAADHFGRNTLYLKPGSYHTRVKFEHLKEEKELFFEVLLG